MSRQIKWAEYVEALAQYVDRIGSASIPCAHVESLNGTEVKLGQWASYVRGRYRNGLLDPERVAELERFEGWQWGPLQPGPAAAEERNQKIIELRRKGRSLRQIGERFDLSRQRVHQILRQAGEA